jgi:predicted HicB family RNase H-like nuclease
MPEPEKEQVVTSLRVDPELWKKAKIKAIENDLSLGEVIDEALREWLQKREKATHDQKK